MHKKCIAIAIVAVLIVGAGMFYAGMKYDKSKLTKQQASSRNGNMQNTNGNRQANQDGQRIRGGNNGGANFVAGSILSKDDKSITVKSQDGSSKIIFFSDSTIVGKTTSGAISDLSEGEEVMVNGKANPDGSISAQNIQIRPSQ